jgi:FkbM family methyltransferase
MLRVALQTVRSGKRLRDKAVIAAHWGTVPLFPLGMAARKLGRPLPDPRSWFGEYVAEGQAGVFACPPGPSPFFLGPHPWFEPGLLRVIDGLRGGTFVDAGASIGFVTVRAARRADRVVAVEPHPVRFAYLERNVKLNGLTNVTCVNCALGAGRGTLTMFDLDPTLGPHPVDISTSPGRGSRFDVDVRALDDLVSEPVTMLKVDVEGAELEVLRGARNLLATRPLVYVESLGRATWSPLQELLAEYSFEELEHNNLLASPK